MSWVRYDDQFHTNPKVTRVVLDEPGALALHLLANTWTNSQKRPGFIPRHQTGVLLCDRELGGKWAAVLVAANLWHEHGRECERCAVEYADLPADAEGYVIHDAAEYRAPARERQTPGTPSELSAKRAEAGRRGGRSTAARREQTQQTMPANAADGASKSDNLPGAGVSPVPVPEPVFASNEAKGGGRAAKPRAATPGLSPEPPSRCQKHIKSRNPPNCGPCADARREHHTWEAERSHRVATAARCDRHPSEMADPCRLCRAEELAPP
jgi:hypothetical protein